MRSWATQAGKQSGDSSRPAVDGATLTLTAQYDPQGGVLGTELVSDLEWRHSRIDSELCWPHSDVFHGVMVIGTLPEGGVFALGVHRPWLARPFPTDAPCKLQRLLPHLQRALHIRSRLASDATG